MTWRNYVSLNSSWLLQFIKILPVFDEVDSLEEYWSGIFIEYPSVGISLVFFS